MPGEQMPYPKKHTRKGAVIAIAVLLVAVIALITGVLVFSEGDAKRLKEQLDLGNRYLSELDYEQAIAAFEEAISIDQKNVDAYGGLLLAYAESGDLSAAADVYARAEEVLTTSELQQIISVLDVRTAEEILRLRAKAESPPGGDAEVPGGTQEGEQNTGDDLAGTLSGGAGNVSAGDIITFGSYEQDGNTANGKEPIEWEVLDVEEDSVLVVSHYVLDRVPYNTELEEVTWENCTLRTWLNTDFYNTAFSAAEQAQIIESDVINKDNEYYGTPGGNNTTDRVFCLSVDEIYRYYDFNEYHDEEGWRASEALIIEATPHHDASASNLLPLEITQNEYEGVLSYKNYTEACIGKKGAMWWLRSPGSNSTQACEVYFHGFAGWGDNFGDVNVDYMGVRPAMRIRR